MKNTLLLIIIILSSFKILAQNNNEKVSFGLKLGYGSSIVAFNDSRNSNVTTYNSSNISVFLNKPISDKFFIQSGLSFTDKGFSNIEFEESLNSFTSSVSTYRLFYLNVPVNALLKLPLGKGNVLLGGGPYVGYALFGKLNRNTSTTTFNNMGSFETFDLEEKQDLNFGNESADDFNPIDFGINFLVGYQIKKGWLLNFNYSQGIANILPKEQRANEAKAINAAFHICLGYEF